MSGGRIGPGHDCPALTRKMGGQAQSPRLMRMCDQRPEVEGAGWPTSLCRLDEDALDDIDNILAAVSDDLQSFVNLFPLENFDGVGSLLE